MSKRILILTVTIILPYFLRSQDIKALQDKFLEAEYFFMRGDYQDALPDYLQLYESLNENANLAYRIGVCYLNIAGKKNLSTAYLETATHRMSSRHKEGSVSQATAPYDALFQLGIAYRINHQFDKAKEAFKEYKATLLGNDIQNIRFVEQEIKSCENAQSLISKPVDFTIRNMGNVINDDKDNYNPVISKDGKSFVFMTTLPFYNAIMYSRLVNGKWTSPVNITPDLQIDGDAFVSSLSSDGKILFLSQDDDYNSDLYFSTYDGKKWSRTEKLNRNINTRYWESHGCISEDGNYLVFASDRPGGFGGLDLYISKWENKEWGPAVNLGPEINSMFNEDRPFFTNNIKTLFFASQDHDNIGGYDIFRSDMQSNGIWNKPVNLGYPLNTTDDDIFFMPVDDGKAGYISLFRETDSYGKNDIYKITFK
jgi:hypothetical protein